MLGHVRPKRPPLPLRSAPRAGVRLAGHAGRVAALSPSATGYRIPGLCGRWPHGLRAADPGGQPEAVAASWFRGGVSNLQLIVLTLLFYALSAGVPVLPGAACVRPRSGRGLRLVPLRKRFPGEAEAWWR